MLQSVLAQKPTLKDGKLSIAEIVAEYNLFVGSEATNYGEHLQNLKHEEL